MNAIDRTKKIQLTLEVAEDALEFLDLKLTFDKEYRSILVDSFAKANNSFTYVLPSFFLRTVIKTFFEVLQYD